MGAGPSFLGSPAAQKRRRQKSATQTASGMPDNVESVQNTSQSAEANDTQEPSVDRVDTLPPANVRSTSPNQLPTNLGQQAIPAIAETSQAPAGQAISSYPIPTQASSRPRRSSFLPEHLQDAIDKKWEAKRAKADAKYFKRCDRLDNRYGKGTWDMPPDPASEEKHKKRRQKIDKKHMKIEKSLEFKHDMEMSMAELKVRKKIEKQQKKGLSTENALPVGAHTATDGAAEQTTERKIRKSRLSSFFRSGRNSSSSAVLPPTTMRSRSLAPTETYIACNMAMLATINTGAASVACMGSGLGGKAGSMSGC